MRHTLLHEPPLPIYIGLNMHQLTTSKKLVQQLYRMGICIAYDRVMEIEGWIATSTSERFMEDGVVSPACLRKGLFTIGALALDNLDLNPSATTSQSSFHGTGISLFQLQFNEKKEMKRKTWCGQTACHNTTTIWEQMSLSASQLYLCPSRIFENHTSMFAKA